MIKEILLAKDFNTRKQIEERIGKLQQGQIVEISGTREELARLQLSGQTSIQGTKCFETDPLPVEPRSDRPLRGEIHKFGINIKNKSEINKIK